MSADRPVTIADIARRAGVSKGAVSYALNGRPGVSEPTRQRIQAIAAQLGWQPSSAARALSDGRAAALGLVVDRPAYSIGIEPFFMELVSGIEAELSTRSVALLLQVMRDRPSEMDVYRHWWAQRRVDGVFLVDLRVDDQRIPLLEGLGMPAVVIGGPHGLGRLPGVWSDDAGAMRMVIDHLASLGHRRVARIAGPSEFWHTRLRGEGATAAASEHGLDDVTTVHTDYSGDAGARATRELLASAAAPTAIVFDNDVMALAGMTTARELGVSAPGELSLVAWDDSSLCQLVEPRLTAVNRDIPAYGAHAAEQLLAATTGDPRGSRQDITPQLVVRDSTAPAPDSAFR